MPATVFVEFDAEAPVQATPRRLHAAWGRVLDLPEGVSAERAARLPHLAARPPHELAGPKPYCLGQMTEGTGTFGVELRFLDDRLLDTLDAWLAWGGVLPLGDGGTRTTLLLATQAQVLETASWEELAAEDTATAWQIRLLTPTVFTSRGRHLDAVTPQSLATSLSARWRAWARPTAPWLPDREALSAVLATQDRTQPVTVSLGMPRNDGRGRLSANRIRARQGDLRVSGIKGQQATRVFSQLMALARFTNVGSHTTYGMGVIDALPAD